MKRKIILVFYIGFIIYSCSPSLYVPASTTAQYEQLLTGRKLYVDHCSSCHNLHFPNEFTSDQWEMHLDEMQTKAKISDAEKQLILEYLTTKP